MAIRLFVPPILLLILVQWVLVAVPFFAQAQIFPNDGSLLNYRIIGFSVPELNDGILQVAAGDITDDAAFQKNIVVSGKFVKGVSIVEVPDFGKKYTWRVVKNNKTQNGDKGIFHHFATMPYDKGKDGPHTRLRILSNSGAYNGRYVFVDVTHTLYKMNGEPVWFVPEQDLVPQKGISGLRDLKMSPLGTVTYTIEDLVREIDYNGKIIWKGPDNLAQGADTPEHFHHQLTRMRNGHYMTLGVERIPFPVPQYHGDSSGVEDEYTYKDASGNFMQQIEFGTLIEFDSTGKPFWRWEPSDYFMKTDLFAHYLPNGKFPQTDVHENAFYLDTQRNMLYVGYRNISRILKIKYPEGKVVAVYGLNSIDGQDDLCNDLFCGQHSLGITGDGNLYIYNNNAKSASSLPRVIMLKEPEGENGLFEKVWEYECPVSGLDAHETSVHADKYTLKKKAGQMYNNKLKTKFYLFTPGGNAIQLSDGCFLINTGGEVANIYIVDTFKNMRWSAIVEQQPLSTLPWMTQSSYRASIIDSIDLHKLIMRGLPKSGR